MNKPMPLDPVILPVIRRVMPNLIAQSIIGVQPMTAPSDYLFTLRSRYARSGHLSMNNNIYRHFLRLNNRKKYLRGTDLDEAGYPSIVLGDGIPDGCKDWCNEQFGRNAWLENSGVFWFRDERDVLLFKLTWINDYDHE